MMKKITLAILLTCLISGVFAQDNSPYQKYLLISKTDTLPYRLLLPLNYEASKKYPVIFFLHGSGEKGNDNQAQLIHGGTLFLVDSIRKNYPAIVVFPQCARRSNWVDASWKKDSTGKFTMSFSADAKPTVAIEMLQKLIKKIIHQYPVNKKQIYVGGLSLGGMGTYDIVQRNPKIFAAAFPICGAADLGIVSHLKRVNWWIFHGADDKNVPPYFDVNMVDAMKQLHIPVKFTLYPNTGHNSWDKAFVEPTLFGWLFSNVKK